MAWVRRNCRQLVSVCRDRRRWDAVALQDPPDRRGADAVAEFEQLALDPHVPPARVLPRHPHHQGGEDVVDRWPSGPVRVGPSSADEAAMPAQDRVRGDQAMATQRSGQPPHEGGEHGPVRPVQAWSWVGAAQDGDLVAQHEELDVLGGGRAAHQQDQPEHLPEDQVQQPQRHAGIMSDQRSPLVSDPGPTSGTPQAAEASWDAGSAGSGGLGGPPAGDELSVPTQDRGRRDEEPESAPNW